MTAHIMTMLYPDLHVYLHIVCSSAETVKIDVCSPHMETVKIDTQMLFSACVKHR